MPQMASKVEMMYIKVGKDGMDPGEHELLQHMDSTLCIADTSDRPVLFYFTYRRFTLH